MPFGVDHLFGDIPEFCLEVADLAFYLLRFLLMGDEAALFIRDRGGLAPLDDFRPAL